MLLIVVGGIYYWNSMIREFFYPGATPEEVEKLVTRRVEQAVNGIQGIKQVGSKVLEGLTVITLKLEDGADRRRIVDEVRSKVDRVRPDLPEGVEDPSVTEFVPKLPVISVMISGEVREAQLRREAKAVEDDLLALRGISDLVVSGVREREIWIEVQPQRLEEHRLTLAEVGQAVAASNLDLPGGQLKGKRGNIRVRTVGESSEVDQIRQLVINSDIEGNVVRLRDVAQIRETFEDKVIRGRFNGKPAVMITIFKTADQDALEISSRVKAYVDKRPSRLDGAVSVQTSTDLSRFIRQRLELMMRTGGSGLILVLITMALFLELRVAFWVAIGIPISFLGTFILMGWLGATINLITLFGLIVVLGIIVDDAIVIGENVFTRLRAGESPARAAVEGAVEVGIPVVAAVTTTIVAFLPLAFISGTLGTFLRLMSIVVIAALSVSLVEALIILPAHLAHVRRKGLLDRFPRLARVRDAAGEFKLSLFEKHLSRLMESSLRVCLRWRYVCLCGAFGLAMVAAGLIVGGTVPFQLIQRMDAETLTMDLEMAAGTPERRTIEVIKQLEKLALKYPEVESVFSVVGTAFGDEGVINPADPATVGQLTLELLPADDRQKRKMNRSEFLVNELRRATRTLTGVSRLKIKERAGGPGGPGLELRLRGSDLAMLDRAVDHVRMKMGAYQGVAEVSDNLKRGKLETRFTLRESARALGLTTRDLALQLRHALFGYEAQELQVGNDQVKVRVLLPESSREELADLELLRVATLTGGRPPLSEVASLRVERGYAALERVDGQRAVTIEAEVDEVRANLREVSDNLSRELADIGQRFPGVTVSFEGRRRESQESVGSLAIGFPVALFLIYAIIAVLFRSYVQPLIVMAAIPFAIVGAVFGHLIMGYPFTLLSMIGCVALSGIVVNDSIILVDFINRRRAQGGGLLEAVVLGARSRLRAILLTSITTIAGLTPLMTETSFQAQFLIPMAVSIVFGLTFATIVILFLIPTVYLLLEDGLRCGRWLLTGHWGSQPPQADE